MTDQSRSLTAIMFTDIVGYTSLMEKDEAKAIEVRERHREIVGVLVKQFQGTVVDKTGDEILTTFPSALRAVDCSLAIQAALRDDSDLKLRIGIHLGEVLKKEDEVIGDGVNVASRIRPLARAGGICVSESILHLVRNRPHIHAEPLGPHALKNVDQPVKVFALADGSLIARPRSRRRRVITVVAGIAVLLLVASVIFVQNRVAILSSIALTVPRILGNPIEQKIGFATTSDGVQIAYATTGEGPPLISVLGWGTHLERAFGSPMYDPEGWIRWASQNHLFVRYDGRGYGLSDRDVEDFSLDARVRDLEAVVDALGLERFALYAVSAGGPTAIAYAVRHSERVSRLILAATFAKWLFSPEERKQWEGMIPLFETSWDSILVRTMMVKFLKPDADEVYQRVGCEFWRLAGDGPAIAGFVKAMMELDARELAREVDIPTLVVHGQEDPVVPLSNGRDLASLIPSAQFEIIAGADHYQGAFDSPKTRELIAEFLAPLSSN
jgi:class 3 adenylate cyclase/pimeloyl-ACP methyl ester carboxylesterase